MDAKCGSYFGEVPKCITEDILVFWVWPEEGWKKVEKLIFCVADNVQENLNGEIKL
jgi:hypothetical protein